MFTTGMIVFPEPSDPIVVKRSATFVWLAMGEAAVVDVAIALNADTVARLIDVLTRALDEHPDVLKVREVE